MPLTTTSGYTFPTAGVPSTQNPESGKTISDENIFSLADQAKKSDPSYWEDKGGSMAWLQYLASTGDPAGLDKFSDYLIWSQKQDRLESREDSAYQRMTKDLQAAGFNPWALATLGASPIGSGQASSGGSSSFTSVANAKANREQDEKESQRQASAKIIAGIIAMVGMLVVALI